MKVEALSNTNVVTPMSDGLWTTTSFGTVRSASGGTGAAPVKRTDGVALYRNERMGMHGWPKEQFPPPRMPRRTVVEPSGPREHEENVDWWTTGAHDVEQTVVEQNLTGEQNLSVGGQNLPVGGQNLPTSEVIAPRPITPTFGCAKAPTPILYVCGFAKCGAETCLLVTSRGDPSRGRGVVGHVHTIRVLALAICEG